MGNRQIRTALERHWAASDANDFEIEHEIYRDDATLDYPQSGERIRGRRNIQESRAVQPNKKRFTVRRIMGNGDLWITEFVLTYDGMPTYTVSIMKFRDGKVASETQYFCDPFKPGPSRAHLVELVDRIKPLLFASRSDSSKSGTTPPGDGGGAAERSCGSSTRRHHAPARRQH